MIISYIVIAQSFNFQVPIVNIFWILQIGTTKYLTKIVRRKIISFYIIHIRYIRLCQNVNFKCLLWTLCVTYVFSIFFLILLRIQISNLQLWTIICIWFGQVYHLLCYTLQFYDYYYGYYMTYHVHRSLCRLVSNKFQLHSNVNFTPMDRRTYCTLYATSSAINPHPIHHWWPYTYHCSP